MTSPSAHLTPALDRQTLVPWLPLAVLDVSMFARFDQQYVVVTISWVLNGLVSTVQAPDG